MYEFLTQNPVLAIIFIAVVIVGAIFLAIKVMQKIGLDKIRLYAYRWFQEAEYEFQYGENEQKFEHVIQLARSMLPKPFCYFITERLLRKTMQLWFNICKDLLDDGKINGTGKEEEK